MDNGPTLAEIDQILEEIEEAARIAYKPPTFEICDVCGEKFAKKVPNQRFCSVACRTSRYESLATVRPTARCLYCQKEFEQYTSRHKFCSDECRYNLQIGVIRRVFDVTCPHCRTTFSAGYPGYA